MLMFGWKKKTEAKIQGLSAEIEDLDINLIDSFTNVKNDTKQLFEWVNNFYDRISYMESSLQQVNLALTNTLTKDDIRQMIDYFYREQQEQQKQNSSFQQAVREEFQAVINNQRSVFEELQKISLRVTEVESRKPLDAQAISQKIDELRSISSISSEPKIEQIQYKVEQLERNISKKPSTMREKILKKISRHSKEYVKSMVLSLIKKYERISALQLRDMLVEEQGLLSKSSFYRLLEEVEKEEEVSMTIEGKEKIYFFTLSKIT